MRQEIVVPGKHGMSVLMLALKEAEIIAEDITVHMQHKQTETKQMQDKGKIPTVIVHGVHINKTTTLPLPTGEYWRKAISEDNDIK